MRILGLVLVGRFFSLMSLNVFIYTFILMFDIFGTQDFCPCHNAISRSNIFVCCSDFELAG